MERAGALARRIVAVFALASLVACPRGAGAAPAEPSALPKILALAKEWFLRFQSGNIDRSKLDVRTNEQLTDDMIRQESATLKPLGRPIRFIFFGSQRVQYATGYKFGVEFRAARVIESIAFDADGKIGGFNFQVFLPK